MVWKTREDKLPPASYFSMIAAYLQRAYPGARISREMMETLRPYFIDAWRNGKTAEGAASSTCSCSGREIGPSPVVGIHIAKGSVRPPKGVVRGDVFGADALRPPAAVERLERQMDRLSRAQKKEADIGARWARRAETARKEASRNEATRKQAVATSKYDALRTEAARVEAEIRRLRRDLDQAERAPAPQPAPAAAPAAPAQRATKRRATNAPAAVPEKDAQSAAMLSAIQGMLPDLAGQLAAQMAKEAKKP